MLSKEKGQRVLNPEKRGDQVSREEFEVLSELQQHNIQTRQTRLVIVVITHHNQSLTSQIKLMSENHRESDGTFQAS